MDDKKIRIGLDARTVVMSTRRGIGKTMTNIYKRIPLLEPSWEFYLYYYPGRTEITDVFNGMENIKKHGIDIKGYWRLSGWPAIWTHIKLPLALLKDKITLLHCPSNISPYYTPCTKVVTIADLIPLNNMEVDAYYKRSMKSFRRNLELGLKTAAKIITLSEYSKEDILTAFGKEYDSKIEVIYLAPEENCRPLQGSDRIKAVRDKYSIKHPYIFVFGYDIIRKNIKNLMEGFAAFTRKLKDGAELVIAGMQDQFVEQLKDMARHYGIEGRVIFTGFVPEEDIPYLLSGAEFLMYVSICEGFGLPPLDAMACDCPVITSNVTSIPEIVGDAAILVDPYDTAQIADAMANLFNNTQLRQDLIARGRERVKLFSWEKAARQTLNVYRQALGEASAA